MHWKLIALLLVVLLMPSFIGFPITALNSHFVFGWTDQLKATGPSDGKVLYMFTVLLFILILKGRRILGLGITAAALVSLSIVFAGGTVAFIKSKIGLCHAPGEYQYTPYYLERLINILAVVPVTIAIFMTIPFFKFETSILSSSRGVTLRRKALLMIVRVINHIRYSVITDVLSILREEKQNQDKWGEVGSYFAEAVQKKDTTLSKALLRVLRTNLFIAASVIAASIEFIPLWAVEISSLPRKIN